MTTVLQEAEHIKQRKLTHMFECGAKVVWEQMTLHVRGGVCVSSRAWNVMRCAGLERACQLAVWRKTAILSCTDLQAVRTGL